MSKLLREGVVRITLSGKTTTLLLTPQRAGLLFELLKEGRDNRRQWKERIKIDAPLEGDADAAEPPKEEPPTTESPRKEEA